MIVYISSLNMMIRGRDSDIVLILDPEGASKETIHPMEKQLYRLDDGIGSGPALIERKAGNYLPNKAIITGYSNYTSRVLKKSTLASHSCLTPYFVDESLDGDRRQDKYGPCKEEVRCVATGIITSTSKINGYRILNGYAHVHAHKWSTRAAYRIDVSYYLLCQNLNNQPCFVTGSPGYYTGTDDLDDSLRPFDDPDFLFNKVGRCTNPSIVRLHSSKTCTEKWIWSFIPDSTMLEYTTSFTRGEHGFWYAHANGLVQDAPGIHTQYFSKAFYNAEEKLPQLTQNTIANLIEIVTSIMGIIKKPGYQSLGKGQEVLKQAWLSYRYAYNTTKADIEELANLLDRLSGIDDVVKAYGYYTHDDIQYHCELVLHSSQFLPEQASILQNLRNAGIRINLTNAWDMVPYSFIVDWFLDVSSLLGSFDAWFKSGQYQISECWYSFNSLYPDGGSVYGRWRGNPPKLPSFVPMTLSKNKTTWLKRAADTISLVN